MWGYNQIRKMINYINIFINDLTISGYNYVFFIP